MIEDNPSTVTITRKTWTHAGGKRTSSSRTLSAQTARLYNTKGDLEYIPDDGRFLRRRGVKMLCYHDADVLGHTNTNEDTFTLDGRTYLVKTVNKLTWNGVTVSKQCYLEEQ